MTIVKYFIYYLFTGLISIIGVFGGNPIPDTDKIPEEDIWRGAVLYLVLIAIWVSISFFLRKKRTKSKKACVGIAFLIEWAIIILILLICVLGELIIKVI
jgi:hypothetical protein